MSQRIADASAKVARSFYALPRMTDNVLSASLGQLAELSGEVVQHSNVVKSFSSYSARQQADQPLPDAHRRGILSQRSSAIGWVMPVAHRNARVKLDCEKNRQSTAISLSEAPPLAMLCFALSRRRLDDVGHHVDQPCSLLAVSAILAALAF
jgi:hypothetical protein